MVRSPSARPAHWALSVALGGALVLGGVGGFFLGRARPAESVVRERVRVALTSPAATVSGKNAPDAAKPLLTRADVPKIEPGANLADALRTLFAIGDPVVRLQAMREFMAALPSERWWEVFAAIETMGESQEWEDNPNSLMVALGSFEAAMGEIAKRDPEGFLLSGLAKRPDAAENDAFVGVFRTWAARDLEAAKSFFDERLRPLSADQQRKASEQLAREFVKRDAPGTFEWIKSLPAEVQGETARQAFQTLSHVDSVLAAEMLVSHEEIPNREEVAAAIGQGWAKTEPEKALAWALELPAEISGPTLGSVAVAWIQKDPAEAARRAWELDVGTRAAFLPPLAEHVPETELADFANKLRGEPAGDLVNAAAQSALSRWAEKDATAASQWLAAQPPGAFRDAGIAGLATTLRESDPASAFEWMAVASDVESRRKTLDDGLREWAAKDPAAARAWVQTSARLSAADRELLLERTGR